MRFRYVAMFIFFVVTIFSATLYSYALSDSYILSALIAAILSVVFGLLYAKAAILPIVRINEEIEALLKESLHELKIPIATVLNNAEMLKNTQTDEKNAKRVERILISARRARDEQERLLELLKSSISEPSRSIFELRGALDEVIEPFLDTRGVEFVINVENIIDFLQNHIGEAQTAGRICPRASHLRSCRLRLGRPRREGFARSLTIKCDRVGFIRALTNIVENSIKFKKGEFVRIEISYEAPFLSIKDNGIGISQGESLKIFDRFYKSARPKQGFGLGLFIVKSYCDKEGIKIYIDSNEGEGTTFSLDLSSTLSP